MTEAEWNACTDPPPMLQILQKVSDRKLRLFAVACCRRIWPLLVDPRSRLAVEVAEGFADATIGGEELDTARKNADSAMQHDVDSAASAAVLACSDVLKAAIYGSISAACAVRLPAWQGRSYASSVAVFAGMSTSERHTAIWSPGPKAARSAELREQAALLRDVFGNPFRPVPVDPAWLARNNATVVKLAQAIYDERAFDRLPILADALEDAGCHDADILGHCRGPGPHARGCWAVDLLLEKA